METVGLATSNIHFDHDGDGVLTRTGWAGEDDALLVWDRNANGTIDTGAELFGDFTQLPNGTLAPNGFAALAALDANGDGILDASDPAFAELKLWRDSSQDGVSQGGEFITLAQAGIVSLNLAHTLKNQNLANGNQLTREGSFTRADGSAGGMGEFRLAADTFDTKFAEQIEVPEALKTLPNMGGSGNVRELQQAAVLSSNLQTLLEQFAAAPSRAEQKTLLADLIQAWAETSAPVESTAKKLQGNEISLTNGNSWRAQTIEQLFGTQLDAQGHNWRALVQDGVLSNAREATLLGMLNQSGLIKGSRYIGHGGNINTAGSLVVWTKSAIDVFYESSELGRRVAVLERFNGSPGVDRFVSSQGWRPGSGPVYWAVNVPGPAGEFFNAAYDSLTESVYASLVMQTRLRPYLNQVELVIDDSGIRLDTAMLNQTLAAKRAADPENFLADLLDLDRYASGFLAGTNWRGLADFDQVIDTLPQTAGIAALLSEFKVRTLTSGDDVTGLTNNADTVLAGDGKDTLYGYNGGDRLFGQGGDDRIFGGNGDDLLSGGAGNDVLYGEAGADTYVFGRGFGNDTVSDYAENGVQRDSVRLLGLTPADIQVTADHADNLTFTIKDTGETLKVPAGGYWWGKNGVGQYVFDDGTVWRHDDALRATVAATTEGDDVIHGSSAGDTITGQAGNDTLIGNGGNDVIDGGAGNDLLIGSTRWNYIYENGQYRTERGTTAQASPNGNDTYLFGRGDGQDTVIDGDWTAGNSDTLRFKEGVAPADVKFMRNGNDLVLAIRDSSDEVTLKQYFDEAWNAANGHYLIERIAFADGTVLSFGDVQATLFAGSEEAETIIGSRGNDHLTGQAGNDTLLGNQGDDVLEGGGGDDTLLGSAGRDVLDGGVGDDVLRGGGVLWGNQVYDLNGESDTYRFGRGDGNDTLIEDSWQQGETDRIEFKAGVMPGDVRLQRERTVNGWQVSDDLKITIRDSGETLTVKNHFNESNRYAVEEIAFADSTVWNTEAIKSQTLLGGASDDELRGFNGRDDLIVGGSGSDKLYGLSGNDVLEGGDGHDELYGGDGNDVLAGGVGNDILEGGAGSDTYHFGLGGGQDVITDGYTAGTDAVELASGVTPADVTVRWTVQGDMTVRLPDGSRLTVRGQADASSNERGIEQLRFVDSTVWNRTDLASRALAGSPGDDDIVGGYQDDTLEGGVGDDRFQDLVHRFTKKFT